MSLAYENDLDAVAWVNSKDLAHADESVPEDEELVKEKQEKKKREKEKESEKKKREEEKENEERKQRKEEKAKKKEKEKEKKAATTPRSSSKNSSVRSDREEDSKNNTATEKSKNSSSRPNTQPGRKREPRLLIPLRSIEKEHERSVERSSSARTTTEDAATKKDEDEEKKPFPERLWKPKTDYAANPPKSVVAERESSQQRQIEQRPQTQPEGQKREFSTSALRVEWGLAPLPKHAKDLSKVEKMEAEKVEKLTDKLVKPLHRPVPKDAPPPEPKTAEEQEAIVERLTRERKIDDTPKYKIIEPMVLDEDDVGMIVNRLAAPKREPVDKRHIPAPPKRKLENADEENAITGRLYQKDFYGSRHTKWSERHMQSEGYSTSEVGTYDQFHKLTQPSSGRRSGAGNNSSLII